MGATPALTGCCASQQAEQLFLEGRHRAGHVETGLLWQALGNEQHQQVKKERCGNFQRGGAAGATGCQELKPLESWTWRDAAGQTGERSGGGSPFPHNAWCIAGTRMCFEGITPWRQGDLCCKKGVTCPDLQHQAWQQGGGEGK